MVVREIYKPKHGQQTSRRLFEGDVEYSAFSCVDVSTTGSGGILISQKDEDEFGNETITTIELSKKDIHKLQLLMI